MVRVVFETQSDKVQFKCLIRIALRTLGDADGLGATRKTELIKSTKLLGLRREDEIYVFEDEYVYFL